MATSTVSHHVFRRTARKMERKLERQRLHELAILERPGDTHAKEYAEAVRNTSYRVAKRNGGLRWAVEKVTS